MASSQVHDLGVACSRHIRVNEHKFIQLESLNIFIGSWNVNAKFEDRENIPAWLNISSFLGKSPDIIVIGLQEIIELSATNTIVGSSVAGLSSEKADRWLDQISMCIRQGCMNTTERSDSNMYEVIDSLSMVGVWCCIFAKKSILPSISNVQARSVARGAGGILGNKGGVCIRMDINDTSICFVCAHLSAHREDPSKRNEDYRHIFTKKIFTDQSQSYMEQLASETVVSARLSQLRTSMNDKKMQIYETFPATLTLTPPNDLFLSAVCDHDIVFFFGDLNYRIMMGVDTDEVFELLSRNASDCMLCDRNVALLAMDQLAIERAAERAFQSFQEGKINFKPTYKYIAGTDLLDSRPEGKLRCPAWCDRILWRLQKPSYYFPDNCGSSGSSNGGHAHGSNHAGFAYEENPLAGEDGIQWARRISAMTESQPEKGVAEKMILHFYARAENCISDHKPVKAFFTVLTKIVDGASREETLLAALPAWQHSVVENRATSPPGSYFVEVSPLYVDDKNIKWGVNREFSLRMTSKLKSSSAVSIPVQLLLSTVPAWIDVLSTTGVSQDGEMMSFAIVASTPLRLTFSVNYQNAMRYISDTTGQDQGAPPVTSSGTCAGTTGGMSVELCATLTFAFQGHSYHDSSGDCIVIPVCFSFEWYGDDNTPFRGTDLQFLD